MITRRQTTPESSRTAPLGTDDNTARAVNTATHTTQMTTTPPHRRSIFGGATLAPWLLVLAALVACSDTPAPEGVEVDEGQDAGRDVGGDNNDPGDTGDDGPTDANNGQDADSPEDEEDSRLPLGALCTESDQCESFLCFFIAGTDQGFCSSFCIDQDNCPEEGFDCLFLQNQDEEISKVCVPLDLCIDEDGDTYGLGPACTGRDCDDGDDGRNPAASEICDGVDNDCDGIEDDSPVDANETCDTGIPGVCAEGRTRCQAGELSCDAVRFGSTEICDGRDNDCDGQTDEGDNDEPIALSCYLGPEGTEGVGACQAGARVCIDGQLGDCVGQVLPFAELCDGADNDCDGEIDEGNPQEGVSCNTDGLGLCRQGQTVCDEQGQISCVAINEPGEEVCDGQDNDCDGQIDEDEEGQTLALDCYEGDPETQDVGLCVGGVQTCVDGAFSVCQEQILPVDELCDGQDNDCDDQIDEGNPAGGRICPTGLPGVCARGETACGDEGLECVPQVEASDEICDNLDNDCDGSIDENEDGEPIDRTCYNGPEGTAGQGVCRSGTQTCQGGEFGGCVGEIRPSLERCDGVDNDCDGEVDNGNPGGGVECSTGLPGRCAVGLTACGENGEIVCVPQAEAAQEVCDGEDNDCDGLIDEGEDGDPLERTCYNGPEGTAGQGICRAGAQTCQGGSFGGCVGEIRPALERCDGVDNDCDGELDENNPGAGLDCSTGLPGLCDAGVTACNEGGAIVCVQLNEASAEVCDGEDNDCDGAVDEDGDGEPLARDCYNGPEGTAGQGICRAGAQTCQGGRFGGCVGEIRPAAEICDGIDNDCSGEVDDGNPGGGVECSTGQPGRCAVGLTACGEDGEVVCVPQALPQQEVCDGFDNDCDGEIDEDENGDPIARSCFDGTPAQRGQGICQDGVEVCLAGQFGACQGQVLPTAEVCDNIDNDCSGVIDDGNPGGGIGCTTGQPGICATGQTVCQGGAVVCQADSNGEAELCDGIDNDCDGTVDNGFAGLGQTCFAGEGICRRAGVQICNPNDLGGAPICDAQEGDGNDQELCDNIDDDCDGEVDEDFRNGDGVYDAVVHCGGCGVDCNNQWPGGPQLYNVAPNCQTNGNGAQCGFACVGNFVNLDGVPDNGCEFLPDPDAIYVSRPVNGGSDADPQCGTFDSPCATISNALSRALGAGAERVRVSNGLFRENVQLVAGIDLLGGHNADNWDRNPAIHVTAITGNTVNPDGPDRVAVSAIGVSVPTELSGFTINAENADAGGNSIGLYILDSDDGLTVRDCVIFAGSGGAGADGQTGQSGPGGLDGAVGPNSVIRNSQCPFNNPACFDFLGGAGGQRVCNNPGGGTTNVSGGNGGGSNDPNRNDRNFNGGNGGSGIGGGGGQGGGHLLGTRTNGRRCTILAPPAEPAPGSVGQPGSDGNGGVASADTNGAFNNAQRQWRGATGVNGQDGQHGGGGGGGGGAAGVDAFNQDGDLYYGAGGGGGGSGGCAGFAGGGGTSGGGSFAILMAFTGVGPASADQMPDLFDNRLVRGQGGNGGNGGNGGAGGDPGLGAEGGVGLDDGDFGFCLFDGAIGAEGGRGGHAGGGAGGNGGVSFDIYVQNTNNNDPGYGQLNDFELEDNVPTAGAGGAGGSSSNVNNGAGGIGRGGDSGNVLAVP